MMFHLENSSQMKIGLISSLQGILITTNQYILSF